MVGTSIFFIKINFCFYFETGFHVSAIFFHLSGVGIIGMDYHIRLKVSVSHSLWAFLRILRHLQAFSSPIGVAYQDPVS